MPPNQMGNPLDYYVMWIGGMAHVLGMFDAGLLFFPQSGLFTSFCLHISLTGKRKCIDRLDGNKIISSQHTLLSNEHRISMYRDNTYNYVVCSDERRLSALCMYIVAGGELCLLTTDSVPSTDRLVLSPDMYNNKK